MREKEIEKALVAEVRRRHGMALKFNSMGCNGVPDRICLFPDKGVAFVELKSPGKKMRPLQMKRKRQLEGFGFPVYCIDSRERIGEVLDEIYPA